MIGRPVCLLICGGMHSPRDSDGVLAILAKDSQLSQLPILHFSPTPPLAVLSGAALRCWLEEHGPPAMAMPAGYPRLIIWAFSAGCVGALALTQYWQRYRGGVLALFLVDGWGVPGVGSVPIHRLSHDRFTHRTSGWLGPGLVSFVGWPAVSHRQLWRDPQQVWGYQVWPGTPVGLAMDPALQPRRLTAGDFLCGWSRYYLGQVQ